MHSCVLQDRRGMAEFCLAAAALLLVLTAAGVAALWRRGKDADRMLSIQMVGSASVGVLLLLAVATSDIHALDGALVVALLAAFAALAFRGTARTTRG